MTINTDYAQLRALGLKVEQAPTEKEKLQLIFTPIVLYSQNMDKDGLESLQKGDM